MNGNDVAGGFMLLGLIILFALPVIGVVIAMVKGFDKVERFDRNRAIERNLRNEVIDADVRQKAARKLLGEYEQ